MKIYLAAAESYASFIKDSGYSNIFTSFYIKDRAGKTIELLEGERNLVVDSGAHSFFSQRLGTAASVVTGKIQEKTSLENLDAYVDDYCSFIDKYKERVKYFVELDIDRVAGLKKVLEIREKLATHCGREKLMVCYHPSMGSWEDNRNALFEFDYIGLQGIHSDGRVLIDYVKCVKDCYENGKKVHVFAMTKKSFLEKVPVYSTDSSSWQVIFRFGKSVTKNRTGILHDFYKKQMRRPYLENRFNCLEEIKEWDKLQKYFTDLWLSRGIDWDSKINI